MKLPNPPAGSLHILPPWLLLAILCTLLFALLVLFLWWRARRTPTEAIEIPRESDTTGAPDVAGFTLVVNKIEAKFLANEAYRNGLHALAAAIRSQIEAIKHFDAEEMTVAQIKVRLDDHKVNNLLKDLRTRQFGEADPNQKDFKKMCSRAKRALEG